MLLHSSAHSLLNCLHSFPFRLVCLSLFALFRGAPWPATAHNRASSSPKDQTKLHSIPLRQGLTHSFILFFFVFSSWRSHCRQAGHNPPIQEKKKRISWFALPPAFIVHEFHSFSIRLGSQGRNNHLFFELPIRKSNSIRKD